MHHKLEDIKVWNKAIQLSTDVYSLTADFPTIEIDGLISQMRRSAVSVASNIAEGAGRNSPKEFIHFFKIATGSSYELQTQLLISFHLKYVNQEQKDNILNNIYEIQKMIYGFIQSLEKSKI